MAFHRNRSIAQLGEQTGGEGVEDLLRAMVRRLVQEAIQAEFDRFIGAGRSQRTATRRGWRNGLEPRTLRTRVGTLVLRIPQDREGRFQPSLFERYQRSERALTAALIEMYVHGVSTRKVSRIVEQLCGHMISASAVSAVTKKLDEEVEAWRCRSLAGKRYRYLTVDAHDQRVRREDRVLSTAVLWVEGIDQEGFREHLGVWTGSAESLESWGTVFRDLLDRGVAGVEVLVSDEHLGLVEALQRYFPHAAHQRCTVHYLRNALSHVSTATWKREVRDSMRDIWAAPTREEAKERAQHLISELRKPVPKLADWLDETLHDTLTFLARVAPEHRRLFKTTNSMEYDHAEVRRRSRVVRIFPNEASLIRLLGALAIERNEQWLERRYMVSKPEAKQEAVTHAASPQDARRSVLQKSRYLTQAPHMLLPLEYLFYPLQLRDCPHPRPHLERPRGLVPSVPLFRDPLASPARTGHLSRFMKYEACHEQHDRDREFRVS